MKQLHEQVIAYGDAACDTGSPQSTFVSVSGALRMMKGFTTSTCTTPDGCCIQAAPRSGSNATALSMAACDPTNVHQQFEPVGKGKPGQIRDKASGRCLSVKTCEISTTPARPDRTCVAVDGGRAPYANSSLADMVIQLNTGDFAQAK